MSVTAGFWLLLFAVCVLLGLGRSRWGIIPYLQTAFAFPAYFWWGQSGVLKGPRWSLISGVVLLISVLVHLKPRPACAKSGPTRLFSLLLFATSLNAVIVTFFWSSNFAVASATMFEGLKVALLGYLIELAISDEHDFDFVLILMVLGIGFLGFEATVFKAGEMVHGRLEGLGPPGANGSNQLACLTVTLLPIIGGVAMTGRGWKRWTAVLAAPFAINMLLLCNSRGSFLGIGAAAFALLALARGKERRLVIIGMCLGGLGLLFLLKDAAIIERFVTTFAGEENRDKSAQSRVDFWKAGLNCVADHPLGIGGGCYKSQVSIRYIAHLSTIPRSVHNGPLDEMISWGIQGLLLRLGLLATAMYCLKLGSSLFSRLGNTSRSFQGLTLVSGLVGYIVSSFFGDFLDAEWGVWMCALAAAYLRLALVAQATARATESYSMNLVEQPHPFEYPIVT
ncbi:MAG: O-antigen ligase family protein [Planctomycetota bacterium]|nr:O-antigen ligase family protein [Planctomycetota bacterium]